jgi:hypothetical protein
MLPDNVYTVSRAYDIGNNGNASDIRLNLDFSASAKISDLEEVRLVIAKNSKTLTIDQVLELTSGNFLELTISGDVKQVIKPLATLKDSDGDVITNGNYKAYIATFGIEGSKQLSEAKELVLSDKPVFAGDYIGTWEDLGPPGPAIFPMSLRIADDYSGKMYYANATFTPFGSGIQDAITSMSVTGTTITSFTLDQLIGGYMSGCAANKTLTGDFNDDINLVLDTFSWSDCDGTRNVILKFTKQ